MFSDLLILEPDTTGLMTKDSLYDGQKK